MAAGNDAATGPRPPLASRLTGRQWLAVDGAVAVVAVALVMVSVGRHGLGYHAPTPVEALLAVAATAPAAIRRLWPVPAAAVVTAATVAQMALGPGPSVNRDVVLGMVVYMAAARSRRPAAIAVLAGCWLALSAAFLATADSRSQADAVRALLVVGALWFVGDSVRERRRYLAGLAEQEAQRRRADAERAGLAVREERVRIARELHDVVAHSLSVVTIQAGVGRKIGAAQPGEALRALRSVEVTGRCALEELRRILGLLRDDDGGQPSLAPVPGLDDLAELADNLRAAGLPVRLAMTGDATALPPAAALTVYRIVQEALTNVVRHARGADASVLVRIGPDGAHIVVTDHGPGSGAGANGRDAHVPASTASTVTAGVGAARGHGIVGMRERAAAFGGTLEAGPLPGGGFQVRALLPVPGLTAGQLA